MFNEDWYPEYQINNLITLVNHVKNLEGKIIEIGCWEGKSTVNLANNSFPENLICNDTWLGNIEESKCTGVKHDTEIILEKRDVYSIFINNMNKLTKQNYSVVKKDCLEWLKDFDEPVKFIHIDASHEYDTVYKTIKLVLPNMVKGGVICGDDYLNAHESRLELNGGVQRAVKEALPNHKNIGNLWYYIFS